ncbi:MAG: glucosaminidase domain-containing protein [Bacilli bacterium]|nr:glucosaminidase domain-containing protein [Bacilli bacterium]
MLRIRLKWLLSLFCIVFSCALSFLYLYFSDDKVSSEVMTTPLLKGIEAEEVVQLKKVNAFSNQNLDDAIKKVEDAKIENKDNNEENKNGGEEATESNEKVEEVKEQPAVVYDGMTMDELASKLESHLKNDLSGKGYLYASYALEKGVDPYLAVAISLEETGCNSDCSTLVKTCHNVGGMKGSGCGMYGYFDTLDEGIKAFIDNIYKNYVSYGLTTADTMNPKYAENPAWAGNVNNYINIIKNS